MTIKLIEVSIIFIKFRTSEILFHFEQAVILEMIKHDASVVEHTDIDGRNALMWACGKGTNKVVQALLELKNEETETTEVATEGKCPQSLI